MPARLTLTCCDTSNISHVTGVVEQRDHEWQTPLKLLRKLQAQASNVAPAGQLAGDQDQDQHLVSLKVVVVFGMQSLMDSGHHS